MFMWINFFIEKTFLVLELKLWLYSTKKPKCTNFTTSTKLSLWQNYNWRKTPIVTKQKLWQTQILTTQILTKPKLWQNSH